MNYSQNEHFLFFFQRLTIVLKTLLTCDPSVYFTVHDIDDFGYVSTKKSFNSDSSIIDLVTRSRLESIFRGILLHAINHEFFRHKTAHKFLYILYFPETNKMLKFYELYNNCYLITK